MPAVLARYGYLRNSFVIMKARRMSVERDKDRGHVHKGPASVPAAETPHLTTPISKPLLHLVLIVVCKLHRASNSLSSCGYPLANLVASHFACPSRLARVHSLNAARLPMNNSVPEA